jgi:hypothetical protein
MTNPGVSVLRWTLAIALSAAILPSVVRGDEDRDGRDQILRFHTMSTIQGALVGTRNPLLRDQAGGGLPWVITSGRGVLRSDSSVRIEVRGLVLADDPSVPLARRLTNPIPTFRAVVSCVKADGTAVTGQTPAASASTDGNAHIEGFVDPPLPKPCVAPIVFVGNGAGEQQDVTWFAATGAN